MIWDANSQTHEEPSVHERECDMDFLTSTTAVYDFTKGQRRSLLGQAIDLNTLVWVFGICLAVQHHYDDYLLVLKTEINGQGIVESKLCEVEE